METYAKQSKPSARTLSARTGHSQSDMATILQAYRNRTAQLAALTDDDEQALQGKFTTQLQEDDDEALQGKFVAQLQSDDDEEPLQGKFLTQLQSTEEEEPLQQKAENRTGLPDQLKSGVENLSGYSLDAVKVHYNSPKPAQLQALAYTQGTDIHVGPGQERYLGHEAWHVVQQMQGRVNPTTQLQSICINDEVELEREADVMGERAASMGIEKNPNRAGRFTPVVSSCPPVQGGWLSDHRHILTWAMGGAGTLLSALVPGAAPIMTALSGGLDFIKGGYDACKAATTPRYNLANGQITISRGSGTIEGGKQIDLHQNYTTPHIQADDAICGKCVATIEIPENENIFCSKLVPERSNETMAVPDEGEETNLRGDQRLITQVSKLKAIVPLLTCLGGAAGAATGVGEKSEVVAEGLKNWLPFIKVASPTAYFAAGFGDIVERFKL